MKKVSSNLKKKVVPNNQQEITNFFGNASSQVKLSAQESDKEIKTKNNKRKATSPLKVEFTNKNKFKSYNIQPNVNEIENQGSIGDKSKEISPIIFKKEANYENNKSVFTSTCVLSENRPQKGDNNIGSMNGPTVKELEFGSTEINNFFEDDWDIDAIEDPIENLDLDIMQRCQIISITKHPQKLELKLKNNNNKGTCFVEGNWLNTPLQTGEIISISASKDSSGFFTVNNAQGLLVLRPDHLISSTSVVAGVFCRRKAVLQERWRGIDSANIAMTMGILIHELVQNALTHNITTIPDLKNESNKIIRNSIEKLYDTGISEQEACSNMQVYIEPLAEFMQTYVVNNSNQNVKRKWNGRIEKVLDIEENVCCPGLGLKGKIDATLQVTIHNGTGSSRAVVPLELKSGRASVSAEHKGQLVLYGMMMSLLRGEHPARGAHPGLLLYLKDKIDLREISSNYPERRDLIILRNELVQHLAPGPSDAPPEELKDIEDLSAYHQSLPEPVHHHSACSGCPYLTLCSLHLWHTDGPRVGEEHPLGRLRRVALGHLSAEHVRYFLRWAGLLRLEAGRPAAPWSPAWRTRSSGSGAAGLSLRRVTGSGDRYLHEFVGRDTEYGMPNRTAKGPQEGDFSIVSIENRPWIAAGVVTLTNHIELHILLERDLTRRLDKNTAFYIDTYESQSTTVHNLTNLGLLMEDNYAATRLRKLIIDKERPQFLNKITINLDENCRKLMRSLNMEQQAAIMKVLKSNDYVLLQGLPGTGKTHTLVVLVCVCVALGRRVLVTAHTHSAVDTLLARLPASLRVFRAGGSRASAAPPTATPTAPPTSTPTATSTATPTSTLTAPRPARSVEQLTEYYNSMQVVGVTCLGASHPLVTKTVFDLCIVDEATQVLQTTVLRPLFAARQFVLVGDPDQLPPVVRSKTAKPNHQKGFLPGISGCLEHNTLISESLKDARASERQVTVCWIDLENTFGSVQHELMMFALRWKCGMEVSLFHRLMEGTSTHTLSLQYRMNRPLMDLANKVAYNNRLQCADDNVAKASLNVNGQILSKYSSSSPWLVTACSSKPEDAAIFLDTNLPPPTKDGQKTLTNRDEACVVLALVDTLKESGVLASDIGVIAPYRDQVAFLRHGLAGTDVEVSTVDQFQGRDKSVIIYSCTRNEDARTVKEGEVLNDKRRLAVSVTRAKHKLIVVGRLAALQPYSTLAPLARACATLPLQPHHVARLRDRYGHSLPL